MTRALTRGTVVTVGTVAPHIMAPASERRDYGAHVATLVRPHPGGRYDTGDFWIVARNGRESVAPVSESMMTPIAPDYATAILADGPTWGASFVTSDWVRLTWYTDMADGQSGYTEEN